MKQKKGFRAIEQKSFQCEIPQTPSPRKGIDRFSPRSLNASSSYYAGGPQKNEPCRGLNQTPRVLSGLQRSRTGLRIKSPLKFPSTPHLGGLFKSDRSPPADPRLPLNAENFEEGIVMLLNRLRELQNLHHNEVNTLKVIISSLKRKFANNPNETLKDTQTSRSSTPNKQTINEVTRLRSENQKLIADKTKLLQEYSQLEKERSLEKEMHNLQISRLRMEVSSLKIKLLKINEESTSETHTPPKIFHLFSYPQYDHTKNEMPERISQIESKFEISHAKLGDKLECQYFSKSGRMKSVPSGVKVHFSNSQSTVKAKKSENLSKLEEICSNSSSSVCELSFLGIDSKELSTTPCENI